MTRRQLSHEFKREAVHSVRIRGVSVAQASRDLDVHATVPRRWIRQYGNDSAEAFPVRGGRRHPPMTRCAGFDAR